MNEEKMKKVLCVRVYGLMDPGTALIIVYVSIVLLIFLVAGLKSARAVEKTLNDMDHKEFMTPETEEGGFIDTSSFVQNAKIPIDNLTSRTINSSDPLIILGSCLLLLALTLAKDRKEL